jgi:hypothetical protein
MVIGLEIAQLSLLQDVYSVKHYQIKSGSTLVLVL